MERILFAQIKKVDEEKRLVYGRAVQEVQDRSGETFDYATSKPNFEKWSQSQREASMGKSAGNVREMHGSVAAGALTPEEGITFIDEEQAIDVCAHVVDDGSWKKVLKGVFTGFSIGGSYVKKWEENGVKKYTAMPSEISLVDRPCGPTSTFFEIQKADGSLMKMEFAPQESTKEKAAVAEELKKFNRREAVNDLVSKGVAALDLVGQSDDVLETMVEKLAKVEHVGELTVEQIINKKIGEIAVAKVGAEDSSEGELDVEVIGEPEDVEALGKMMELNKLVVKDVLKIVGETLIKRNEPMAFGGKIFADEVNKKYPLDTKEQVQAAWLYINKAKSPDKAVMAKIVEAYKSKIDAKGPPEIKKAEGTEDELKKAFKADLRKGMYGCAAFANTIAALIALMQSCEYEAMTEGDDSPIPGKLNDAIKNLGQILIEMVQEEVAEATEGADVEIAGAPPMMALADGTKEIVKRAEAFSSLLPKVIEEVVEKKGARNSKKDQDAIQAMHDHSCTLGAMCKDDGGMAMAEAVEFCKGLGIAKPTDEQVTHVMKNAPRAMVGKMASSEEDLIKSVGLANDEMKKSLDETVAKLEAVSKELDVIKAQPAPRAVRLVAVAKGQEVSAVVEEQEVTPVKKADGSVDEVATLIKGTMAKGGAPYLGV